MALTNRFVNCAITFNNPRIVSRVVMELDLSLRELLATWIHLLEITPEHRVCEQCTVILQSEAQLNEPTRGFGHRSVCLGCGVSVLRARSICIDRNRPEHNIIEAWVPQIQADLPVFTRVCRPCWRKATRAHEKYVTSLKQELDHNLAIVNETNIKQEVDHNLIDINEPSIKQEVNYNLADALIEVEAVEMVTNASQVDEDPLSPPTPPPLPLLVPKLEEVCPQRQTMQLPNYKCVAATSRRCIFSDCSNIERIFLLVPLIVRMRILMDFKIYIPRCARICSDHLVLHNNWDLLFNEHLINTFTSEQIEDMLYLLEKHQNTQFDFENIENMNDHMRNYWVGVTVQQFHDIINGAASLTDKIKNYKTALAMYLAKLRTGDSDAKLSTIFGVAKSTFQRKITIVRECLNQITLQDTSKHNRNNS